MATLICDPNGRKRIGFVGIDGKSKTLRLGKLDLDTARGVKSHVEALIGARLNNGNVPAPTAEWVTGLSDVAHGRLAAVGLVEAREAVGGVKLGAFLADYFAAMLVKPSTAVTYAQTRRVLLAHFGEGKPLASIGPQDADKWRQEQKADGLAESTIARRVKCARQIFRRAVKWRLIAENPFADVKAGSMSNKARQYFVTRDEAQKVLDACPDTQWRLLFALSRYGGLRCPSEHLALTWGDVDWERGRLRVPSCKTEHITGGDCRFIPLFPELRPYLLEAFEQAEPGSAPVITRYRDVTQNLRTQLLRIIGRAGLKPWPKLFHNLRATRQTELAERYPIHVVCAWLGNSQAIAQEHYLQVTDAHFAQAANEPLQNVDEHATRNPTRYSPIQAGIGMDAAQAIKQYPPDLPGDTGPYGPLQNLAVTPRGFEPLSPP